MLLTSCVFKWILRPYSGWLIPVFSLPFPYNPLTSTPLMQFLISFIHLPSKSSAILSKSKKSTKIFVSILWEENCRSASKIGRNSHARIKTFLRRDYNTIFKGRQLDYVGDCTSKSLLESLLTRHKGLEHRKLHAIDRWADIKWLAIDRWADIKWLSIDRWGDLKWLAIDRWDDLKWLSIDRWADIKWLAIDRWVDIKWFAIDKWGDLKWLSIYRWADIKWLAIDRWDDLK